MDSERSPETNPCHHTLKLNSQIHKNKLCLSPPNILNPVP